MDVSIIGTGYVGLTTGAAFAEKGHTVLCVDNDSRKVAALRRGRMPIFEPGLDELVRRNVKAKRLRFSTAVKDAVDFGEVVFLCLPTPPMPSGMADLSFIEAVAREIAEYLTRYRVIVEKSTVPVRTGGRVKQVISKYARKGVEFDVASNPEFLREGNAVHDALNPDRIVLGVESKRAEQVLRELYKPFKAPVLVADIESAELIKHASNSFLALKISYINAISRICELAGADVGLVAEGMGLDHRIGRAFLDAGIGYGGSCFSKDINAFYAIAKELGYDFELLRMIEQINHEARQRFLKKVEQELWIIKGKRIAALGLAFKPNTDDVRESVAVEVVRALAQQGGQVRAYDPQAEQNAARALQGLKVEYCPNAYEACRGADCLLILTEWDEFRKLDFEKVKRLMRHPTILDGRNLLDGAALRKLGFTYRGVGRAGREKP